MKFDVEYKWYETLWFKTILFLGLAALLVVFVGLIIRVRKLQYVHHILLDSKPLVYIQTVMTEKKAEETLTKADCLFMEKVNLKIDGMVENPLFSIDTLAVEMGMSRSVFYRRLKSVIGKTPSEFVVECRMKKAIKKLREESDKPVSTIAYECGFSSPQYFSTVFRKRYHLTPNEWRKQNIE